ncbi:MAG TPA: NAD(P)H-hydrate dehydratase [Acidimicrobiales bacterium]|nr:NAD(P)H-hydrate dehydratase [Acidimicrobiales bacterium]
MKPVLTVQDMRAVDARALHAVAEETLVERAGTAVASWAVRMLGGTYGRRVVVVAGKGNNGADGRVAADRLRRRGARVTVVEASDAPEGIGPAGAVHLVIDAAYGTGFRGEYRAPAVPPGVPVLAVDIPSGVDGDTGAACGEPLRADVTVTFAALKPGLLQGDGAALAGRVEVADIGLDTGDARMWLVDDTDVARLLAPRPRDAHKWQSAVAVVAGSPGMTGAAGLCARAAYRAGAGMVRLGVPGASGTELPVSEAVGAALPARGWAPEALAMAERCKAVVVGPGLGRADGTGTEVRAVVGDAPVPVVVDADGLYALGEGDELRAALAPGPASSGAAGRALRVLTPHDGEFARLAGAAPGPDRVAAAAGLAARCGAAVLLKGPTTVVAHPGGDVLLAATGSPRLATAGTGDVLSGVIGAFVARGVVPHVAAALAAHVHGRAADLGVPEGLVAGDLAELVARWLSGIRRG